MMNKTYIDKNGYLRFKDSDKLVHQWVWEKYDGRKTSGYHIHHKDRNKLNNDISNLELKTETEHSIEHGLMHPKEPELTEQFMDSGREVNSIIRKESFCNFLINITFNKIRRLKNWKEHIEEDKQKILEDNKKISDELNSLNQNFKPRWR